MTKLQDQIAELETEAAEVELIADLATDKEARERNTKLAKELNRTIDELKIKPEA